MTASCKSGRADRTYATFIGPKPGAQDSGKSLRDGFAHCRSRTGVRDWLSVVDYEVRRRICSFRAAEHSGKFLRRIDAGARGQGSGKRRLVQFQRAPHLGQPEGLRPGAVFLRPLRVGQWRDVRHLRRVALVDSPDVSALRAREVVDVRIPAGLVQVPRGLRVTCRARVDGHEAGSIAAAGSALARLFHRIAMGRGFTVQCETAIQASVFPFGKEIRSPLPGAGGDGGPPPSRSEATAAGNRDDRWRDYGRLDNGSSESFNGSNSSDHRRLLRLKEVT